MKRPWDRLTGERERAYRAFLAYRDLGADRSFVNSRNTAGKPLNLRTLQRHAVGFRWVERCREWDNHLRDEADKVTRAEARKWAARREADREGTYQIALKLRARIKKMVSRPCVRKKIQVEGEEVIWEPVGWTQRDIAFMAKMTTELALLATSPENDAQPRYDSPRRLVIPKQDDRHDIE